MRTRPFHHALVGLSVMALLGGCHLRGSANTPAPVGAVGHGETIFRLQNAVMEELIDAQTRASTPDGATALNREHQEDELVEQCASLNQAANLSATGSQPGPLLKLRVWLSLASCEGAALAARASLASERLVIVIASP